MKISQGQTLQDVALQACGSVEGMLSLALALGVSLDAQLSEVTVPGVASWDEEVVSAMLQYDAQPATYNDLELIVMPSIPIVSVASGKAADDRTVVQDGQSLVDMALQMTGSVEGMIEMALLSGITVTEELSAGQALLADTIVNTAMYRKLAGIYAATANTMRVSESGEIEEPTLEGIGYWAIGIDFIVQ